MTPRRVVATVELETGLPVRIIKLKLQRMFVDVRQVQVNVMRKKR